MAYRSSRLIVCSRCVGDAWQWVVSRMTPRPSAPCHLCIYDETRWRYGAELRELETTFSVAGVAARLYLTSQLHDLHEILEMVRGGPAPDVVEWGPALDSDVKVVIENSERFRYALSEHLAFWTRLGTAVALQPDSQFGSTLPNLQPEDKGPDGLFAAIGVQVRLEVQEVKSSVHSPRGQIASGTFRSTGRVDTPTDGNKTGRLLEDFWLFSKGIVGFHRLDRLVDQLCNALELSTSNALRVGLISECSYNAVVVADGRYASVDLFEGYQHVTDDVKRRVATYLGAEDWRGFAERVRELVKATLQAAGVW